MTSYRVRGGLFCPLGERVYASGEVLELTAAEYNDRRHMVELVEQEKVQEEKVQEEKSSAKGKA